MLPELKSTGDAVEFGQIATEEQIEELRALRIVYINNQTHNETGATEKKFEELEANAVWAYKAQFVREAIEVSEGTFNIH